MKRTGAMIVAGLMLTISVAEARSSAPAMTECLPSYHGLGEGAHYTLRMPGHKGERCWYAADGSTTKRTADVPPTRRHRDMSPKVQTRPETTGAAPVIHAEAAHADDLLPQHKVRAVSRMLIDIERAALPAPPPVVDLTRDEWQLVYMQFASGGHVHEWPKTPNALAQAVPAQPGATFDERFAPAAALRRMAGR